MRRYNVINLPHDLRRPRDWRIMQLYELELLIAVPQPATFRSHRDCGSWDTILVCHLILWDHVNKESCDFRDWMKLLVASHHSAKIACPRDFECGDIVVLLSYVIILNYVTKGSSHFMVRSPRQVIILPGLVFIVMG